jgi:hypothetical protein
MRIQLSIERQIPTAATPRIKTVAETKKPLYGQFTPKQSQYCLHETRNRDDAERSEDSDERLFISP